MLLVDAYEPIVVPRLHVLLPAVHIPSSSVQHQLLHTHDMASRSHRPTDFNSQTRSKKNSRTTVLEKKQSSDLGLRLEVAQPAELRQVVVPGIDGGGLRLGVLRRVAARRLGRAPRRDAVEVAPNLGLHPRRLLGWQVRVAARRPRRRHGGFFASLLGSRLWLWLGPRGRVWVGDPVANQSTKTTLCTLYGRATRAVSGRGRGRGRGGRFCGATDSVGTRRAGQVATPTCRDGGV